MLIEAFSRISHRFPEWTLEIIGDDYGDKEKMDRLIEKYNLKNIVLKPSTGNIEEVYKSASFYVMSSRFEGLPMVLLEALAFGLPLVSFDCPTGPVEVVDDSNGFLVKNGDTEALAEAMQCLIIDRDLRVVLAAGSEKKTVKFSKEIINTKWDNLLLQIW